MSYRKTLVGSDYQALCFDLSDGRVSVVLNRNTKRSIFTKEQVEILGAPVARMLPNDYVGVNKAMAAGTFIEPASEFRKNVFRVRGGPGGTPRAGAE